MKTSDITSQVFSICFIATLYFEASNSATFLWTVTYFIIKFEVNHEYCASGRFLRKMCVQMHEYTKFLFWRILSDARASISGPGEVFVKKGSTISLTCSVNVHSTPPSSVLWYHGSSVVDFDSPRGGISLETEKTEAGTTSKLLVTKALLSDSGNYTCMPSNASPASAIVHVLNGEFQRQNTITVQLSRKEARAHVQHRICQYLTSKYLCKHFPPRKLCYVFIYI